MLPPTPGDALAAWHAALAEHGVTVTRFEWIDRLLAPAYVGWPGWFARPLRRTRHVAHELFLFREGADEHKWPPCGRVRVTLPWNSGDSRSGGYVDPYDVVADLLAAARNREVMDQP